MTRQIIVENMKGSLEVQNIEYSHQDNNYTGAQFIIKISIIENIANET